MLRVENNEDAVKFEKSMQGKIGTMTALLMARHKGGEKVVDWLTHASKHELNMAGQTVLECGFNSLLMINAETAELMLQHQPDFLRSVLEGLLEQAR